MNRKYDLRNLFDKLNLTGKVVRIGQDAIGSGGSSSVYEGLLDGRRVAVKVIREFGAGANVLTLQRRLVREVRSWAEMHHRNVLPLLGFAHEFYVGCKLASLVSPWMPHGTATEFLRGRSAQEKLRVLTNIADGLSYLHRHGVVHGDLKGSNILIDERFEPRLGDFGLSKLQTDAHLLYTNTMSYTSESRGSTRWMARELLGFGEEGDTAGVTEESDIWAYGMTVLELFTGQPPYHYKRSDGQVIVAIHQGELPRRPDDSYELGDDVWDVCCRCWHVNPALRPTSRLLAKIFWELDLNCKLRTHKKKRRERDPESPDKEHGEARFEERLKKSPKLGTLAELGEEYSSPGTPRSLRSPTSLVQSPPSSRISRTSSALSMTSSSSSSSNSENSSSIDPRQFFSNSHNVYSEWDAYPESHGQRPRFRGRGGRMQTDPGTTQSQFCETLTPLSPNATPLGLTFDLPSQTQLHGGSPHIDASNANALVPQHYHDIPVYNYDNSGAYLDAMHPYAHMPPPPFTPQRSGTEPFMAPYSPRALEYSNPSQWVCFPGPPIPSSSLSQDLIYTPPHAYNPMLHNGGAHGLTSPSNLPTHSPSPGPWDPQTPIFSEVFGRGFIEEPTSMANPNPPSPMLSNSSLTYDPTSSAFTTLARDVLSPAFSDMTPSDSLLFSDDPTFTPSLSMTDTPVVGGSLDSFDDDDGGLELFGGLGVDENILESPSVGEFSRPIPSSFRGNSSRQNSSSTISSSTASAGGGSCSRQSSRQSSSGVPVVRHRHLPPTPQLSPLLSSF